ncbi:MAG: putative LPS assembly protein LptD [Candidatus Krumholzibacteriia bacterium]
MHGRGGSGRRAVLGLLYAAALLLTALAPADRPAARAQARAPGAAMTAPARVDSPSVRARRSARPATVVEADRFIDRVVDGEPVSFLLGNVYIDRDSLTARADTGYYYREREVFELLGDVRLRQHGSVLTAARGVYRRDAGEADFFGGVRVEEDGAIGTAQRAESRQNGRIIRLIENALMVTPEYSVWGDTIQRDRLLGRGEAFGDVRIVNPQDRTVVTGEHAIFGLEEAVLTVDRQPVLVSRERTGDLLEAVAGLMHFYRDEDRAVFVDSVRIAQGRMEAHGDTAVAYGQNRMILRGAPWVRSGEGSRMTAEEIEFRYDGGQLREILLRGDAMMTDTQPDSLARLYAGLPQLDVLEGDTITVSIDRGRVRRSVVVGGARSIYVPMDLDDEVATNDVSGDTIVIDFHHERVRRVQVRGSMEGVYRVARLAALTGAATDTAATAAADTADTAATDPAATAAADTAATDTAAATGIASVADTAGLVIVADDSLDAVLADPLATEPSDTLLVVPDGGLAAAAPETLITVEGDTLVTVVGDTLPPGAVADFAAVADVIEYSGRSVTFDLEALTIEIVGEAQLHYVPMTLKAERVKLDTASRELYAEGNPLLEETDSIVGNRMGYHFGARTGAVEDGVTSFGNEFFAGDAIRRFPDGTLKIRGGKMTACDLAEPHYHIWADQLKMKMGDEVVARPVVMKVGKVPVFALPFYFKSLESGRRSGILFPNFDFGWSERRGRYIRDLGYFWAVNDYINLQTEIDFNERQDLGWQVIGSYVKRYAFTGGVNYARKVSLDEARGLREWQLKWNHNQPTLFDDYSFRSDVSMASATLSSNDLSRNLGRDVVNGQLRSNVYVSRGWDAVNATLRASRDEFVNAADDDPATNRTLSNMTLPALSLSFRQITLAPALPSGREGSVVGDLLRNTYFSQSYATSAQWEEREQDSVNQQTANGNWSLDFRPRPLGIFSTTAGVSGSQAWTRTEVESELPAADDPGATGPTEGDLPRVHVVPAPTTSGTTTEVSETTRPSLSFNTSLNAKVYGLFPVPVGNLQAIRHTLSMGANYSRRPQLGTKQNASQQLGLTMGHRFDVKYLGRAARGDSLVTRKLDGLIDWQLSTSYNPDAASDQRWGIIGSSLVLKPGASRNLSLRVSNSIDPYQWKILDTQLTYGLSLEGRLDTGAAVTDEEDPELNAGLERLGIQELGALQDSLSAALADSLAEERALEAEFAGDLVPVDDFYGGRRDRDGAAGRDGTDPTEDGRFIPWRLGASISLRDNAGVAPTTSRGNLNISANPTRKWEVSYVASLDFQADDVITRQEWNLSRDLHCWRLEFSRIVSTRDDQFAFRIYLRSLPDVKLTSGQEDILGSMHGLGGGY